MPTQDVNVVNPAGHPVPVEVVNKPNQPAQVEVVHPGNKPVAVEVRNTVRVHTDNESPFEVNRIYKLVGYAGSPLDKIQQGDWRVLEVKGGWIRAATPDAQSPEDPSKDVNMRWLNTSALFWFPTK